jgi:isopenicillin N synthase-like dioxygenase
MSDKRIPIVDISRPSAEVAQAFGEAFRDYGTAVIRNHGVDPQVFAENFRLHERVFDLPLETKMTYDLGRRVGYVPYGVEKAQDSEIPDEKEIWEIRFEGQHYNERQFPKEVPEWKAALRAAYDGQMGVAYRLLEALGTFTGKGANYFADMVVGGDTLFRQLYYPHLDPSAKGIRSSKHTDIDFITIIPPSKPGLQVFVKGECVDVILNPDDMIAQCADMLAWHTEWLGCPMPSMWHQVVNLPGIRRSSPLFIHSRGEVEILPGLTSDEALTKRLREIGLIA